MKIKPFFAIYLLLILPVAADEYEHRSPDYWVEQAVKNSDNISVSSEDLIIRYALADEKCRGSYGLPHHTGCLLRTLYSDILEARDYCAPFKHWFRCTNEIIIEQYEENKAECNKETNEMAYYCSATDAYARFLNSRGLHLKDGKWTQINEE